MNIVLLSGLLVTSLLAAPCQGLFRGWHPQTQFCWADFVVRAKILGKIMKYEASHASQAGHVLGDSSIGSLTAQSSTKSDQDESPGNEPSQKGMKGNLTQHFHKGSDLPPGEDTTGDHVDESTSSLLNAIFGRHKRSLSIGVRGAAPPPPQGLIVGGPRDDGMMYYDVLIKKVFKGGDKVGNTRDTFVDAANPKRFFARVYASSGVAQHLEPGVAYMLSGKIIANDLVLASSACWFDKWKDLSKEQVRGLKGDYAKGCDCNITPCYKGRCRPTWPPLPSTSVCAWEMSDDCEVRHNLCVKQSDQCHWTNGHAFHTCSNRR